MHSTSNVVRNIQFICVCIFFATLNFEMFSPFMENMGVSKIAAFLYIAGTFLSPISQVLSVLKISNIITSVFIMFGMMIFSSIINGCEQIFDTTLFLNIIMFWLLLNHYRRDPRLFDKGIIWFVISASLVGVLFMFGIGVSIELESGRYTIFNDNQNTVGIKMALGILFLINYTLNHSTKKQVSKPYLLTMIIPMLLLMFYTASRTALLILVTGVIVFFLLRPSVSYFNRFLWLIIGIIVCILGFKLIGNQELLIDRITQTVEEGSISGRDIIWEMYINVIKEHPVLGVGFTGAQSIAQQMYGSHISPHNVFIEVALYSGILGFIPFLCFIFSIYKNIFKYFTVEKNLAPLMFSIGLLGMLLSSQALNVKLFWVIAAYAISYQILPKNLT